ncbi:YDG/SRA domain-containing protein [Aeromicrobium tamlense]|nr:YDG/SRA domain-containing protein [Aeromicrobium tamlense]
MSVASEFGEVRGVAVGTWFESRSAVRDAGLHRHLMAGISGNFYEGADAIVLSGGYKDDEDRGDWILYTGQGGNEAGRQVRDQTLTKGNLALALSEEQGLPVRVIRKQRRGGVDGYVYSGLYSVRRHWVEASSDGPLIYRFELDREPSQGEWEPQEATGHRATSVMQRIVRNSSVTQYVKELYDFTCQFCGVRLEVDAGAYAEGAHVRPLGGVHAGRDAISNVLCLCPNDHVLFDKGATFVDAESRLVRTATDEVITELSLEHYVNPGNFSYHRTRIAGQAY